MADAPDTIRVRIVLGRRRLERRLAEALRSGDVLELDGPDLAEVHAGGRVIARGQPVEVDGHLALRITQLEPAGQWEPARR